MSQDYGMGIFQRGDQPQLDALNKMKETMQVECGFEKWLADIEAKFDALPNL
jgi:hypothetical protein